MKKIIAAATVATSVGVGDHRAREPRPRQRGRHRRRGRWLGAGRAQRLVDDGTITQEQADAVEEDARPGRSSGRHHRFGGHMSLPVAEALGVSQAFAGIAEEKGVDVRAVVDAIVAAHRSTSIKRSPMATSPRSRPTTCSPAQSSGPPPW